MTEARRDKKSTIEGERAFNAMYIKELKAFKARQGEAVGTVPVAASTPWTGTGRTKANADIWIGPVEGRVGLNPPHERFGSGFYIGPWHRTVGDSEVISWVAPAAELFFAGREADYDGADLVVARRTFELRGNALADFEDDYEDSALSSAEVFQTSLRKLDVPMAPRTERPKKPDHTPEPMRDSTVAERVTTEPPITPKQPEKVGSEREARQDLGDEIVDKPQADSELRAVETMRRAVERPRTGHLMSVIATLQPWQYRLVAWPDNQPLIVQGRPGTGKTIIATHRAAYLSHPERGVGPIDVLLVGVTDQYADHVNQSVSDLSLGRVAVRGLPTLLRELAGLKTRKAQSPKSPKRTDTTWDIGRAVTRAAKKLGLNEGKEEATEANRRRLAEGFFELARAANNEDLAQFCSEAKNYDNARSNPRFLQFCAVIGLVLEGPASSFDHLIIDEAQDVKPLEWLILDRHLNRRKRPDAQMSLLGDINQRQTNWSARSWSDIASDIELSSDDEPVAPEELGYAIRSTHQILRYANALLPRGERSVGEAMRDGPEPIGARVGGSRVMQRSVEMAEELLNSVGDGMVAIICADPKRFSQLLAKSGWRRSNLQDGWEKDGKQLVVLIPELARGLEFDGVVVVEPADLPSNVDSQGPLYVSLTRATRELAVVWSKALPGAMKRPPVMR